jgi:hypothetical protein
MKVGLLWQDLSPDRTIAEKVTDAAKRYNQKYDQPANTCYIHPTVLATLLPADEEQLDGITLKPRQQTAPGYFWIGTEKKDGNPTRSA